MVISGGGVYVRFSSVLLYFNNELLDNSIKLFKSKLSKTSDTYKLKSYFYVIEQEVIDDRFYWLYAAYDNAEMFSDYVVNQKTGEKEVNPRSKSQVEPRQQFFVCVDSKDNRLYLNDIKKKGFVEKYLSERLNLEVRVKYIYKSLDEFCKTMKMLKGFRFTQTKNLFSEQDDLFYMMGNQFGQDLPEKLILSVEYSSLPLIDRGRKVLEKLFNRKNQLDDITIIGCNDDGIEESYDFESIIQHVDINVKKDQNEHYDVNVVKDTLLEKLVRKNV